MQKGTLKYKNLWEMPLSEKWQQKAVTHQVCNGFFTETAFRLREGGPNW